jgi:integrase
MKNAYRLFRRNKKHYYLQNNATGEQKSLNTTDSREAQRLLNAANDECQMPALNLQLGKVYLTNASPEMAKRTWQVVMDELSTHGKPSTQMRYARELRSKAYDAIRNKPLIETTSDDLKAVLKRGTTSTNHTLRRLHNLALGNGWIHWNIIAPRQWPKIQWKLRRAITQEEHNKIIAAEANTERRLYYQMLWETGAAQTDGAFLTAEKFDLNKRILSYRRLKTGEWCHMRISNAVQELLLQLPKTGLLFPKMAALKDKHRSAEFCRRCRISEINGISLHSYRYAWAERAYALGLAERFAKAGLGHSSTAVHHAYAKKAYVVCPALENLDQKIISFAEVKQDGEKEVVEFEHLKTL